MRAKQSTVEILNNRSEFKAGDFTTGVSLHCHTLRSKEMLDFIPHYATQIPFVSGIYRREVRRYESKHGQSPDLSLGYWEPPLTGSQVFESERASIRSLGLDSMVSITDHDTIQENLELPSNVPTSVAPISMEWTVRYGEAYFHLGIHNLAKEDAKTISAKLLAHTFDTSPPNNARLNELFSLLNENPQTLIVLNHPFWDIETIGQTDHDKALENFVREFGEYLHAIEINGFRPWDENRLAMLLAEEMNLPIVSGGDRHCLSPNTIINISQCVSFGDFVEEIRIDKTSHIVVLPEYLRPLLFRQIRTITDVLGHYPDFPETRSSWPQRIYFDYGEGRGVESLSSRWKERTPIGYQCAIQVIRMLGRNALLPVYRLISRDTTVVRDNKVEREVSSYAFRRADLDKLPVS